MSLYAELSAASKADKGKMGASMEFLRAAKDRIKAVDEIQKSKEDAAWLEYRRSDTRARKSAPEGAGGVFGLVGGPVYAYPG